MPQRCLGALHFYNEVPCSHFCLSDLNSSHLGLRRSGWLQGVLLNTSSTVWNHDLNPSCPTNDLVLLGTAPDQPLPLPFYTNLCRLLFSFHFLQTVSWVDGMNSLFQSCIVTSSRHLPTHSYFLNSKSHSPHQLTPPHSFIFAPWALFLFLTWTCSHMVELTSINCIQYFHILMYILLRNKLSYTYSKVSHLHAWHI